MVCFTTSSLRVFSCSVYSAREGSFSDSALMIPRTAYICCSGSFDLPKIERKTEHAPSFSSLAMRVWPGGAGGFEDCKVELNLTVLISRLCTGKHSVND